MSGRVKEIWARGAPEIPYRAAPRRTMPHATGRQVPERQGRRRRDPQAFRIVWVSRGGRSYEAASKNKYRQDIRRALELNFKSVEDRFHREPAFRGQMIRSAILTAIGRLSLAMCYWLPTTGRLLAPCYTPPPILAAYYRPPTYRLAAHFWPLTPGFR